jgi:MHS family proline/betaine transporter-like MFS transporter
VSASLLTSESQLSPVSRRSILIAAFSTIVEWYDFTLYLYFATVLSRVFFGPGAGSLLVTLAGFAIAYLMRPVGAVVFGHIGDRHGRRRSLLLSVALMTAAMALTGLLPTRAAIGPTAGAMLIALRCVMGFAVGGEYSGVVAYLLEGSPSRRRGLIASLASASSEVGGLAAVGVSALTVTLVGETELQSWGWRIPFFIGAALAASVWIARSAMEESPEFERQRSAGSVPSRPLAYSLRNQRMGIFRSFMISALGSITYYVGITYVPAFISSAGLLGERASLWLSTLAALIVILVTPFAGWWSDKSGRKPVLIAIGLASGVLPVTMFSLMAGRSLLAAFAGAAVLACIAGAYSAVGAAATAEQFAGEGRMTGLALGATGATAVFGGLTPWLSQRLMASTGSALVPGVLIAVVAVTVLPVLLLMPETAPAKLAARRARL